MSSLEVIVEAVLDRDVVGLQGCLGFDAWVYTKILGLDTIRQNPSANTVVSGGPAHGPRPRERDWTIDRSSLTTYIMAHVASCKQQRKRFVIYIYRETENVVVIFSLVINAHIQNITHSYIQLVFTHNWPTSSGDPLLVATHSPGNTVDLKTQAKAPSSCWIVFSTSCRKESFRFWDLKIKLYDMLFNQDPPL